MVEIAIEDLALPVPPAGSVVLRMLVLIAARLTGLDDDEMNADEWTDRRRALLTRRRRFDPVNQARITAVPTR